LRSAKIHKKAETFDFVMCFASKNVYELPDGHYGKKMGYAATQHKEMPDCMVVKRFALGIENGAETIKCATNHQPHKTLKRKSLVNRFYNKYNNPTHCKIDI
jgi:hypothetical protein